MRLLVLLITVVTACAREPSDFDNIYSAPGDRGLVCGLSIDRKYHVAGDDIDEALDRARDDGTILHLYTHRAPATIDASAIDLVLAKAQARGLAFVTYRELAKGTAKAPGLALSFDDHDISGWYAMRPLFDRHGAKVTFFVSAFGTLSADDRAKLHVLAEDGHSIEYHSTAHLDAAAYVASHGVAAYLSDDVLPALRLMRSDGFDPVAFAYPFGKRTDASDTELLEMFPIVRGIHARCPH